MPNDSIVIKGASEHNLKHIDLTLPRNALVVITGVSGSGKSSLAFDTIFAEGRCRYVESLSAYARQFLERRYRETENPEHRAELEAYRSAEPCPACGDSRASQCQRDCQRTTRLRPPLELLRGVSPPT